MYKFELQKATDRLVNEILKVKKGESVTITGDSCSDEAVVNAAASSVHAAEGKPLVLWMVTPRGVGKAADEDLPVDVISGALERTDVWIEFNKQWLLYSTPFDNACEFNKKLRYINLVELDAELLMRNIGKLNGPVLTSLMKKFRTMNMSASKIRMSTPSGTEVVFETNDKHFYTCDAGDASTPGIFMMPGQLNVVPALGTVQGTIVFDGSLVPPCGLLSEPVKLTVKNSEITDIQGGREAGELESFLKSFEDPNMLKMAHVAYGLNPGAVLSGKIVEDERVWGATEWGIGHVSKEDAPPDGQSAKSHCDGICLNSTVWLDDVCVIENGRFIHPELTAEQDVLLKGN